MECSCDHLTDFGVLFGLFQSGPTEDGNQLVFCVFRGGGKDYGDATCGFCCVSAYV